MPRLLFLFAFIAGASVAAAATAAYQPPASPRASFDFNADWKFMREDVSGADAAPLNDSSWTTVSTPHTWNEVDSYRSYISHSAGDTTAYRGVGWYRKHFKLPASAADGKVFLEFEGLKQAAQFFVNGKAAGKFENGVTECGLDITSLVTFGETENVIAVRVDNRSDYKEETSGVTYQWMGAAFNPNFGGLNHDIRLHLTGKIYQTLPLYENLGTTGVYVWADEFDIAHRTATIHVESQVKNETEDFASISLTAFVVDADGIVQAKFDSEASDLVAGQAETFVVKGQLNAAHFWHPDTPYLYTVYTVLTVDGKVVDVNRLQTGFRKVEFKGGAGTGGVYLNDCFIWLTGYSQRSANDWPTLGQAYPDWLHDYDAHLIRSTHANYVRWMHVSPQPVDVRAYDRAGIVEVCPAGDKELDPGMDARLSPDVAKRQWEQRVAVMRDSIITYRNSPSIFFWEAGNQVLTVPHMQEMVALRQQWDPHGGRVMGTRHGDNKEAAAAITPFAEYYGVMIGQDARTDTLKSPTEIFRGYSAERRDRAPLIETEDFRDEALRSVWDDSSPPHFGFKKGPNDAWGWTSEDFALQAAKRYHEYVANRIDNPDPAHAKWSAYASIYWSDSDADGRQQSSAVLRVSGKVDGVRLPKEAYYAYRVMQSEAPDLHILGHWTYPAATKKTVYVIANHCEAVELFLNGKSLGRMTTATDGYVYAFPDIAFAPGALRAVGTKADKIVAEQELKTAGAPKAIRLTPHVGPSGLQANGADVAFIDAEVVDADGNRCPTDEARVDFSIEGPAIWRGGLNSAKPNSTNNLYLDTECGINRVFVRSTLKPGTIVVKASREGLTPGAVSLESHSTSTNLR
jgi:beta-galactosidase